MFSMKTLTKKVKKYLKNIPLRQDMGPLIFLIWLILSGLYSCRLQFTLHTWYNQLLFFLPIIGKTIGHLLVNKGKSGFTFNTLLFIFLFFYQGARKADQFYWYRLQI